MNRKYTRVGIAINEVDEQKVGKSLLDHLRTSSSKYISEADILEAAMVDQYLRYGVEIVKASQLRQAKPKLIKSNKRRVMKMRFPNTTYRK